MNVTRRRCVRRVHVRVSVKVNQTQPFVALAKGLYDSGQRSDRDLMIAADGDGQFAGVDKLLDLGCQALAGVINLSQVLELFSGYRQ